MSVLDAAAAAIAGKGIRILLPEAGDARILAAADRLKSQGLASPVLIGEAGPLDPRHVDILLERRPRLTPGMAERLLTRPLYRAGAMLAAG
ncbi:MAG: phosphate acyltransferase, partial [Pseudomonadota bacterium]|nr:phosphate acyltransferase [Pseudomonadota bacterium]